MYELLKKYIQANVTATPDQLNEIVSSFRAKKVKRNSILLSAGEICKELYFVNKGSIRTYYISRQGKERTRYLAPDGMICTSLNSFISQKPSFEHVDAIENSELLSISHTNFYKMIDGVEEWSKFYRLLLESAYSHQNERIENLVMLTANERYADIMQNHPEYVRRLPNHILASYLDMSQETLSRLKSK